MTASEPQPTVAWPKEGITRIPYGLYFEPAIHEAEMQRIFRGPVWNFLGLDVEVPNPGDYRLAEIGDTSVILVRNGTGALRAFVNRCAHKGTQLLYEPFGSVKELMCIYHNWLYNLDGALQSVPFAKGLNGKGGMPGTFCHADHGLTALRVETINGLVFGTFSDRVEPLRDYFSPVFIHNTERVANRPFRVLGYYSQWLDSNWKLYWENTSDPYHATILHGWATKLKLNRFTMEGAIEMSANGWHHFSWSKMATDQGGEIYDGREFRTGTANYSGFGLNDPSVIEQWDDYGDGITTAIQTAFPNFVLQQIHNTVATRTIVPRGPLASELKWTILGYADDDERKTAIRIKQGNLIGPSGYISMEDGMVGALVQRGIAGDKDKAAVIEMDGRSIETIRGSRASECGVRGFYTGYRALMGL